MKKIYLLILIFLFTPFFTACEKKEVLKIFNWGAYLDNDPVDGVDLVSQFEQQYHCTVKYVTFDSNEAAIAKMKTESYDLVVPSDYAIEQLIEAKMLQPLDWSKIEGYTKEDITSSVKDMLDSLKESENGYDFLEYAVPYFAGSVGILYNPEKVELEELEEKNWDIFLEKKYNNRIAYYDSSRDGFMAPLKQLGYSMNTNSEEEIEQAYQWLKNMKKGLNPAMKTDELISEMPTLKYDMALMYSGDALYAMELAAEKGNELDFYRPTTGTNVWADGMVIPKNAKNVDLAYQFISFICDTDNAVANAEFIGYVSTVQSAYDQLRAEGGYYEEETDYYFLEFRENDEMYRYNETTKVLLNTKWLYIRME